MSDKVIVTIDRATHAAADPAPEEKPHMQTQRATRPVDLVTPEILVQRAREMVPRLKARSALAESERRLPKDTVADMKAAGFFRILQPKQYGGYEMDPEVFYDVCMTLAEGCMSTAWVYGVVGVHN